MAVLFKVSKLVVQTCKFFKSENNIREGERERERGREGKRDKKMAN
jgi:hypothetical protein